MQNLRDKLLKAGLVSDEQAKKAETPPARAPARHADRSRDDRPRDDRPHARGAPPSHGRPPPPRTGHSSRPVQRPAEAGPKIPKLPPLPGSREYQRLESKKQLELDRKLLELARTNEIPAAPGEHTFYFVTRKGRLRRLEITPDQAAQLERGELAIVERREPSQIEHALVPPAIAEQMRALAEKSVRFLNTPGAPVGFLSDADIEQRKQAEVDLGPEEAETSAAPAEAAEPESAAQAETPPTTEPES